MISSAATPRSSSDLYSPSGSDAPLQDSQVRPNGRPAANDDQHSTTHQGSTDIGNRNSSSLSQYDKSCESQDTIHFGKEDARPTAHTGTASEGSHKRKREHEHEGQESGHSRAIPPRVEAINALSGSEAGEAPHTQKGVLGLEIPKPDVKRTRTNGTYTRESYQDLVRIQSHEKQVTVSRLPIKIWQYIFCFVPPVSLGRLLRVNRVFKSILTPGAVVEYDAQISNTDVLGCLNAETIWTASRTRFAPGLPRPIHGVHELNMWRLLRGNTCQLCGQRKTLLMSDNAASPWQAGPGQNGVRIIWPFGIRCCGPCLQIHTEKEVMLLFSQTFPSILLPTLPFAFVSQSEDYIASITLKNPVPLAGLQLTKNYYKADIEDTKRRLEEVRSELGPASAEEWTKGLHVEVEERSNDTARWEKWEAKGGLRKVNLRQNAKSNPTGLKHPPSMASKSTGMFVPAGGVTAQEIAYTSSAIPVVSTNPPFVQEYSAPRIPSNSAALSTYGILPQRPQVTVPLVKTGRNIHDVNESKAARRAEIERRCLALDPPIKPNVLCNMESFQAALQISTSLTDAAWEVLKPRLLAQRESAEQRENEKIQQSNVLHAKSEERKQHDAHLKEAKETLDKEWDIIQAPVRDQLAIYADQIIQEEWAGGSAVTKDTAPKFAADVLLHVRRRFYERIAEKDKTTRTVGEEVKPDPTDGPSTRKLILENMKWVFDNKIRSFTEHFQKELFLCNGCDGNTKFYGFEGVIQHYAAKHTTSLSVGSIIVHWRAEWPEGPPFHPNPSAAKAQYYAIPLPTSATIQTHLNVPQSTTVGYGEYPGMTAQQIPHSYTPQFSPTPYRGQHPNYFTNGPYNPPPASLPYPYHSDYRGLPQMFQLATGYPGTTIETVPTVIDAYPNQANASRQNYPAYLENSKNSTLQQPTSGDVARHYPFQHFQASRGSNLPLKPHSSGFASVVASPAMPPVMPIQGQDLYQTQMNEMAREARDVWFGTSGIKDIPQSVRIYVVIHHVVRRFAQTYTNEPSLAMFIDGLDHNAQMRPVRSLNGLACKKCVEGEGISGTGFHTHPYYIPSDRRLYTLPHLLNHFKTVHVERARTTVNLQSGLEVLKLDWKRDMIELPETPLIADLINAPGMDDAKLQLIAEVLPGVFPLPLPSMGAVRNTGPVPKQTTDQNGPSLEQRRKPTMDSIRKPTQRPELSPGGSDYTPTKSLLTLRPLSQSSTRTSEPVGEDEYDPNRPAFYGRMVETQKTKSKGSNTPPTTTHRVEQPLVSEEQYDREGYHSQNMDKNLGADSRINENRRPQYLTHHSRQSNINETPHEWKASEDLTATNRKFQPHHYEVGPYRSNAYNSEDGEINDESQPILRYRHNPPPAAEATAAEQFLNELAPTIGAATYFYESGAKVIERRPNSLRQGTHEPPIKPHPTHIEEGNEVITRRNEDLSNEQSVRSTPSRSAYFETRDMTNMNYTPNVPDDPQNRFTSRTRYSYQDERNPVDSHSPHTYGSRGGSHAGKVGNCNVERIIELPRSTPSGRHWPQMVDCRSRTRSPQPIPIEPYRTRSPQGLPRHEQITRGRSPPSYIDGRSQRVIQYAYPPMEEEYQRTRMHPEDPSQRRVEYVPIRAENYSVQEPGRYIITQPIEHRRPIEDMRLQRTIAREDIYERDGQLYYADSRQLEPRPARAMSPEYIEYRRAP